MKVLRGLGAVIILVLLFIFTVNNIQTVHLRFLSYRADLPLFLVIVTSFVLGFLLAALLSLIKNSQLRRQIRQLEKEAQLIEKERSQQRSGPPSGA